MPEDWLEPQERQKQEAGQGEAAQKHTGPELWLAVQFLEANEHV